MEISILPKSSLKIKGKNASFVIDPKDSTLYNAAILLGNSSSENANEEMVVFNGPGEYEVGGIKISGVRSEMGVNYSLSVDGVDIALGRISSLEKLHTKMKEHNIVVALCDEVISASFLTSLSSNTIILYGEKAVEVAQVFGETVKKQPKYSTTKDKLPLEVETVVLE
jgi:hypothetical protein